MNSRTTGKALMAAMVLTVFLCVGMALAGSVYDRAVKAIGVTTGTAIWTNDYKFAAIQLSRIWVERSTAAGNTVTVSRVTSDGTYTQAVGSVTAAVGIGSTDGFTAKYLANGDTLVFTSAIATGSTAVIEFEVQKH